MIAASDSRNAIRRAPEESIRDYQSRLIQLFINDKTPAPSFLFDPYGDDVDDAMARDITDWLEIANRQHVLHDKVNLKKREDLWRSLRGGAVVVRTAWGVAVGVEVALYGSRRQDSQRDDI